MTIKIAPLELAKSPGDLRRRAVLTAFRRVSMSWSAAVTILLGQPVRAERVAGHFPKEAFPANASEVLEHLTAQAPRARTWMHLAHLKASITAGGRVGDVVYESCPAVPAPRTVRDALALVRFAGKGPPSVSSVRLEVFIGGDTPCADADDQSLAAGMPPSAQFL